MNNIVKFIIIGALIVAIPVTIKLVQEQQNIKSKAAEAGWVVVGDGCQANQIGKEPWPECRQCNEGLVKCNENGQYLFQSVRNPSPNCGASCVSGGTTTSTTQTSTTQTTSRTSGQSQQGPPGTVACQSSVAPNTLGINDPNVCDRLHEYVVKNPISKGGGSASCAETLHNCTRNEDCPQNNSQPNLIVPAGSNWCYGFKDGARCIQLRYKGTGSEPSCVAQGDGGGALCRNPIGRQSPDLGANCSACIAASRSGLAAAIKSQNPDLFYGCSNKELINYWCNGGMGAEAQTQCNSDKRGVCASACSGGGSTPNPPRSSDTPDPGTGGPSNPVSTTHFRIAESLTELTTAPWQDYTAAGMTVNYDFRTAGQKFLFVEFKDSNGKTGGCGTNKAQPCPARIKVLGSDPTITSCFLSFEGSSTVLNLTGTNFGSDKSLVKSGDKTLQARVWKDDSIQAVWSNALEGQVLPVSVLNSDGQTAEGQCGAISKLALGAKVFCRAPSSHQTENVDLTLMSVSDGSVRVNQKVRVDKDGIIQGLSQKLETGKDYLLSLKAPKSLRRTVTFTAATGITNIPNFILPVGDIFPVDGGDGAINALDKSALNRQWAISTAVTGRSGDFNQDGRVNSIDWACMRYDFGDSDDAVPAVEASTAPIGVGATVRR